MLSKLQKIVDAFTMGPKGGYYAVRRGRKIGVFRTWRECEKYVKGFPGARFKKFSTNEEAENFVCGSDSGYGNADSSTAPISNGRSKKRSYQEMCDSNGFSNTTTWRNYKHHKSSSSTTSSHSAASSSSWLSSLDDSVLIVDRPIVYTDGCCTKNGRRGARAGVGVYWGPEHSKNISDRLEGEQTNQRAEIMAAVKALETAKALGHKTLEIRTDSKYTIYGATDWCLRWKKNGWKTINGTEVKNKTEFQTLTKLCDEIDVKWTHVPGHRGIPGNEAADSLARSGSLK
ncbi:ribonuclease H1-like [Montipora foliosa]|uniref:ribonuclease H1-like n=1 Tax=Montipora foliosa TaxID=591990 RepID=UPI0035F1E25D